MTATEVIQKVNKSTSVVDIFDNLMEWKPLYIKYSRLIHPDMCKESGAKEAFQKLGDYKDEIEKGKKTSDDAGEVIYTPNVITFKGKGDLIITSHNNYLKLVAITDPAGKYFQEYLPHSSIIESEAISYDLRARAIPLSALQPLKQEYVNFILSRMLEVATWISQERYVHAGFNPDSIYVVPETHGIQVVSFYHMQRLGAKLKTISGKWSQLYPGNVFTEKKAETYVDLELAKRTAIWLLGDQSGTGTKLRKTHNTDFLDFTQKTYHDPLQCYDEYRAMLRKNFDTKQFHILNI